MIARKYETRLDENGLVTFEKSLVQKDGRLQFESSIQKSG